MISDFSTMITQAILPGSRVPRFNGWDEFVKFNIPRDSELIGIDADDSKNYLYMKKVDKMGVQTAMRYDYNPNPVEEFEPDKYVTKAELNDLKEEMKSGFNSIRELIAK